MRRGAGRPPQTHHTDNDETYKRIAGSIRENAAPQVLAVAKRLPKAEERDSTGFCGGICEYRSSAQVSIGQMHALERAIACYTAALQVHTRDAFPADCEQTLLNAVSQFTAK